MLSLEKLIVVREEGSAESLDRFLMPIGFALGDLPEVAVASADAIQIRRGQSVLIRGRDAPASAGAAHATHAGKSIAVGEIGEGAFHPKRVFKG